MIATTQRDHLPEPMRVPGRNDSLALTFGLSKAQRAAFQIGKDANRASLADLKISCIVPCLNESGNLAILLPALEEVLVELGVSWEIIVVDDGSTDETAPLMEQWRYCTGVSYLQLSRNFGKEAALSAGLAEAEGHAVVLLDADMQHPVSLIPEMLRMWLEGMDNVYAVRKNRNDESLFKRWGSKLYYWLLNPGGRFKVPANAGDFRLLDRQVADALKSLPERNRFMKGLYAWVGFPSTAIEYLPLPRAKGQSHFRPMKLLALALTGITAFSTWPLHVVSCLGIVLAIPSFIYGVYLVADYLINGHAVSGWTTIVTIQLFSSGAIMLSIGVAGEYIARIFDEVKARPNFLIRQSFRSGFSSNAIAAKNNNKMP